MAKKRQREIDVSRLCQAMSRARTALRPYREERREMVRQFAGNHWGPEALSERVPVNLLALYVSIVGRNLIAKNPRVMLSSWDQGMKPTVTAMEAWANQEIEKTRLQETLQRAVVDALFSVGVVKVALATPAESAGHAWTLGAGQPFAQAVDLDDFVYDVHARDWGDVSFIGHRYRVPLEVVKDSSLYDKAREDLAASHDSPYNLEGDERIGILGRGYEADSDEFEDWVDLWEVYLPGHRAVLTLADDYVCGAYTSGGKAKALREQDWLGPDSGPYHLLGFGVVPGSAMPKAPIMDLMDLHQGANETLRKVLRTVERIKELTLVQMGATADGERIMHASDGEILRVDNPDRTKILVMGGQALQQVLAVFTVLKDLFSWAAGNLDMMGGLSPQSKTATQDQLLSQNASRTISDMQDRTVNYTSDVLRALLWYWYHDPFLVQKSLHSIPGLPEMQLPRRVTPQARQRGKFEDLDLKVDPYSMRHQSPQERLQAIQGIVQQVVVPMMPLLAQQQIAFDINAYLQKIGEYLDMPDLAEIVTIAPPPESGTDTAAGAAADAPKMPQKTQRDYVRHNMPGSTREASDRNLVSSMLGHSPGGNPNGQPNGAVR